MWFVFVVISVSKMVTKQVALMLLVGSCKYLAKLLSVLP